MVKLIADSTCDLPAALIEKYDISIVPLHIICGDKEYRDGVDITPDSIYQWADANKTTPKTSAVSPDATIDLLKPFVDEGREVICFSISSKISATFNVMCLAVESLEAEHLVTVIDSDNITTGIGLLVLEAAQMAAAGRNAREITEHITAQKPLVRSSFVVDTLTYLHRGGRCSSVAALAGGVLKLHPRINVENGKMDVGKKYRGKMSKVIMDYVKDMETDFKNAQPNRVFITHSGCDASVINEVSDYLKSLNIFKEIDVARAGGVISSHCGPGTLGVIFISR